MHAMSQVSLLPWVGTPGVHWGGKLKTTASQLATPLSKYRCGRDYCDSKEIMSIADAMVANGMQAFGYEYINMDGELYSLLFPTV